jgi:hypothetical protein
MLALFATNLLHFVVFYGTWIALLVFCGLWFTRSVRGERITSLVFGRMVLLGLLAALLICLVPAFGFAWLLYGFQGPDGDPPSDAPPTPRVGYVSFLSPDARGVIAPSSPRAKPTLLEPNLHYHQPGSPWSEGAAGAAAQDRQGRGDQDDNRAR